MKISTYLHVLQVGLTAALVWLVLNQRSELKIMKDDISVAKVFFESLSQAAVKTYNPQIELSLQQEVPVEHDITVRFVDEKRVQVGPDVFSLEEVATRLPPTSFSQKKRGMIIAGPGIPMVDYLGKHGLSDITFAQQ